MVVNDSVLAAPRCPRYRSLDAWRGIACVSVVLYHSTLMYTAAPNAADGALTVALLALLHQLNVGVTLFFVISGYCIAAASDNARRQHHPIGTYFTRRFRRIYPPLWAATGVAVVAFLLFDVLLAPGVLSSPPWPQLRPWWYSPTQWLGNLTLTESWRHYVGGSARGHFPGQAWTLCYEEQFYAVMGALLLLRHRLFHAAAAVTVLTVVAMAMARTFNVPIAGFFFDGNWLTFAAGVLVYWEVNYGTRTSRYAVIMGLATAATVALPAGVPGGATAFLFAMLLLCLHPFDAAITTAGLTRPLMWCGQMCYSLYLVHQLVVKGVSHALLDAGVATGGATLLVTVPVCLVVALGAGRAFYLLVERRFLNPPVSDRARTVSPAIVPSTACDPCLVGTTADTRITALR